MNRLYMESATCEELESRVQWNRRDGLGAEHQVDGMAGRAREVI